MTIFDGIAFLNDDSWEPNELVSKFRNVAKAYRVARKKLTQIVCLGFVLNARWNNT